MRYTLYEVGGRVRDHFLGIQSKDIDYSVVIDNPEQYKTPEEALVEFEKALEKEGFEVYISYLESLTIKAKFPDDHTHSGVADFVIARKELGYIKGTRQPEVILGTLEDDLTRRDFTVNALARDIDGNIIDLFNGQRDLLDRILRTPKDAAISFTEDPLRILRAIRFAITKGLEWSDDIWVALVSFDHKKFNVVSTERVREELTKCFKYDTMETLKYLNIINKVNFKLYEAFFPDGLWLEPTTKK